MFNILLTL